ncbi:smf-dependent flagellar motor protein MotY [Neiella marina]|uniref:Smf-dependent flagellar motor protein MotY n=1 Tax=Neiella marina TaxID=508461 RepID=A0A8J2U4F3_9GAMM|nr:OmpA family protein [Neiella marina]GGA73927.1 smf-dependent flagellar motor protein MotY [Neiella marina]
MKHPVLTTAMTIGILSVVSPFGEATVRQYAAPIGHSDWVLTQSSPLVCQLEHGIPSYGTAVFTDKAGSGHALHMTLEMLRRPQLSGNARLMSVPPSYKPGMEASLMANVQVYDGFNTMVGEQLSWQILTELEQGNNPTLFYQDGYSRLGDIEVALNSANFRRSLNEFVDCVGGLLPYGYDDVAISVLNYKLNSDELELESLKRLRKVVDYLRHDDAIVRVEIDAFSDSYGGRWLNFELSKKRAAAVKDFMIEQGVKDDLLITAGYGERRHVASNKSPIGRHKNRRVVVRLTRDNSQEPSPMAQKALTPKIAKALTKVEPDTASPQ